MISPERNVVRTVADHDDRRDRRDPLATRDVGDGEQGDHRHDDDVERWALALDGGPRQHVGEEAAVAARHQGDADDDQHSPDDRRAEGLDQLHGAAADEQVGAHGDRQQHGAEAAQPREHGEQHARKAARRLREVLLDGTAGADGEIREDEAEDEHQRHDGEPDGVGGPADAVGDGWLDHLDGRGRVDDLVRRHAVPAWWGSPLEGAVGAGHRPHPA